MIRAGLIAYLLLATIAGPAWCCCTLARAVSSALQTSASEESTAPYSCCCPHGLTAPEERGSENEPTNPHEKCPCQESRTLQPGMVDAIDVTEHSLKPLSFGVVDSFISSVSITVSRIPEEASAFYGPGFLHFSGRDLLSAYQILRC